MSRESVMREMENMRHRYGLDDAMGAVDGTPLESTEVVMHELAHGVVLGLRLGDADVCTAVTNRHDRMNAQASDIRELLAIAVEWRALEWLGVPVSSMDLAITASHMMRLNRLGDPRRIESLVLRAADKPHVLTMAHELTEFVRAAAKKEPRRDR